MRCDIILFDLDGTLTDSGPGIMKAGQYALRAFGIERDWRELSFFVGPDFAAPYELAPAYDMTPMAFAPRSGGSLPDTLADANIRADVPASVWREVARLADDFLRRARATSAFSPAFAPCLAALERHLADALGKIDRLG